jgi:hypothetical protein
VTQAVTEPGCRIFKFRKTNFPAPVLDPHGGSAVSVTVGAIIKALKGTEPDMESVTADFLTGFALEMGVEFVAGRHGRGVPCEYDLLRAIRLEA